MEDLNIIKHALVIENLTEATKIVRHVRQQLGDAMSHPAVMTKHPVLVAAVFTQLMQNEDPTEAQELLAHISPTKPKVKLGVGIV